MRILAATLVLAGCAAGHSAESGDILDRSKQTERAEVQHILLGWSALEGSYRGMHLDLDPRAQNRTQKDAEQLAKQGRIHSHTEYIALTGSAGGFMLVQGEVEELQKILLEPENLALTTQATMIVQDFEQNLYAGGSDQTIQQLIGVELDGLSALGFA